MDQGRRAGVEPAGAEFRALSSGQAGVVSAPRVPDRPGPFRARLFPQQIAIGLPQLPIRLEMGKTFLEDSLGIYFRRLICEIYSKETPSKWTKSHLQRCSS